MARTKQNEGIAHVNWRVEVWPKRWFSDPDESDCREMVEQIKRHVDSVQSADAVADDICASCFAEWEIDPETGEPACCEAAIEWYRKDQKEKAERRAAASKARERCFKCKWRGSVPGSAHSCCKHPAIDDTDALAALVSMLKAKGCYPWSTTRAKGALQIEGDQHGVAKGWFMWPHNFDPTWLRQCNGYEPKDGEDGESE